MAVTETKTIHEFLAENPNVDVSQAWERLWGIQKGIVERVKGRFDVNLHPACEGREYYAAPDGRMEGSFAGYTGDEVDWLVNSWIGNRKASILDINATVFLGQQTRVPHLTVIFGTIPKLFFYADYTPRADIRVDLDYLNRYYEPVNEDYLAFRSNPNFTWSVSHGTYLRGLLSPVCISMIGDLNDSNIDTCEAYLAGFIDRWFGWLDDAELVPESEQAALRDYDYRVRELGYRLDPMNALVVPIFGQAEYDRMLALRMGKAQMEGA